MATWAALNVEPEDEVVDLVDDTKELQLEEAFKLYSEALKLHAKGLAFYPQAKEAYDALFQCEVFKYAETLTEDFAQDMSNMDGDIDAPIPDAIFAPIADNDTPSTAPQVLYLAYKNHGQFILDCLRHGVKGGRNFTQKQVTDMAKAALEQFVKALIRDESDTELWRRTARLGKLLGSDAISRYCLEAAVEVDDDPANGEVDPANLEEGFAGIQLKEYLESLGDDMALSHPIMGPYVKKEMPERLRKYLDPYPYLGKEKADTGKGVEMSQDEKLERTHDVLEFSWQALGQMIMGLYPLVDLLPDNRELSPAGTIVRLRLPEQDSEIVQREPNPEPKERQKSIIEVQIPLAERPINILGSATLIESPIQEKTSEEAAGHKRTLSTAGLPEPVDEESGREKRAKRTTRKRETLDRQEIAAPVDPLADIKAQYEALGQGDEYMLKYAQDVLAKFEVKSLGTSAEVKELVDVETKSIDKLEPKSVAIRDLRDMTHSWESQMWDTFQDANGLAISGSGDSLRNSGLTAFIEHSKTEVAKARGEAPPMTSAGLAEFVDFVNKNDLTIDQVAYEFFKAMAPSYRHNLWPQPLKTTIMQFMNLTDKSLQAQLKEEHWRLREQGTGQARITKLEDFAQMLLELHIDMYVVVTGVSSQVDVSLRTREKDRLDRCFALVEAIALPQAHKMRPDFYWRNQWASFLYASFHETATREHMIGCWTMALNEMSAANPQLKIILHNNMAMPEISPAAADRELSRLTTMDAFLNVFSDELDAPTLIERLEPVLDDFQETTDATNGNIGADVQVKPVSSHVKSMRRFLENKGPSLRLYLWQRLRDAYRQIDYPTKVFSCHLRSIEIIVDYILSLKFKETAEATRRNELLGYLMALDNLLVKALTLALNEPKAFEIIDEEHLKSSMIAIANLCRILHSGSLLEDQMASGLLPDNSAPMEGPYNRPGVPKTLLKAFFIKISEMSIRSWALLYTLIKEGVDQNKSLFTTVNDDLAEYLAVVHYSLGLRHRCERSNKIFIKMMRVDLLRMGFVERWEDYLGQVLWDLHGLRLGDKIGVYVIADHGCEKERLDKRTALSIVDHVTLLAHRMPLKDLLRDELRYTIDAMQQVIGVARTNVQSAHNMRIIKDYCKSSLNPLSLARSLKGMVFIDTLPVYSSETTLAQKGWYFLLGMIALTKFRSVKRTSPGGIDDLKIAGTLFRTQLQFQPENWEAWYRLAQVHDSNLDELVLWSADDLNGDRTQIVFEQRAAIHCYAMAVSTAIRSVDASFETAEKLGNLYHDFGTRIYATSRDPFHMEPFYMDDFSRHMSGQQGMYFKPLHAEMSRYKAWRFAATLFKRALHEKPNDWLSQYMLGKCYWKMFQRWEEEPDTKAHAQRPRLEDLVETLEKAVSCCPKPRDSRVEPILEPHYKIVSVLHKLVTWGLVPDLQVAADTIQKGRYAINKGKPVPAPDLQSWEKFTQDSIRHLRSLDKANWHHRFISRAAHLVLDQGAPMPESALAAHKILTTNGIFSKTMVASVWKPEHERPGRHSVYMSRYVKFMITLCFLIKDKSGMENLVKRVRRRGSEYWNFAEVWGECVVAYIRTIREVSEVKSNQDELVRVIPAEEVGEVMDALESWTETQVVGGKEMGRGFGALTEAVELKKLNGLLFRTVAIDDLVIDAYATLLWEIGTKLPKLAKLAAAPVVVTHPPDIRQGMLVNGGGVMGLGGVMNSIEAGQGLMPGMVVGTTEVIENAPKRAKHPSKREILKRAEILAARASEKPVKDGKGKSESRAAGGRAKMESNERESGSTEVEDKMDVDGGDSGSEGGDADECDDGEDHEADHNENDETSMDENHAHDEENENGEGGTAIRHKEAADEADDADDESDLSSVEDIEEEAIEPMDDQSPLPSVRRTPGRHVRSWNSHSQSQPTMKGNGNVEMRGRGADGDLRGPGDPHEHPSDEEEL